MRYRQYAVLFLLTITGCAGNDRLVQRQTAMEARLEQVAQAQQALTSRMG